MSPIANQSVPSKQATIEICGSACACEVRDTALGAGVFATRDIPRGARILSIDGRTQRQPTRYSIQLDADLHIEAVSELPDAAMRVRHPWRFLNHACEPNARVQGRSLLARRPIRAGEQVTFDYTTTESDMAEPFTCGCGAATCLGLVRGFAHLDDAQRRARATRLAPHLRSTLATIGPAQTGRGASAAGSTGA